jgi:sugar lactone lactonase YvrE
MIRMSVVKTCLAAALSFMTLASVAAADDFKLVSNQRIACGRGLAPGKLNTATCKSYAYVFNAKTSEYARCQVTLALTRDNKEVINVQADGNCTKKQRIFDTDSSYSFDATETEPPNTNSFFGPGGYVVWASDSTRQKVRGCITIASGLGTDVSKCVDMTFQ